MGTLFETEHLRVREAAPEDLRSLRDLLAAAPAAIASPGLAGQVAPPAPEQLLLSAELEQDRLLLLLVERSTGRVAGLLDVRLFHPWPRAAFIELLLLATEVRGRGYGSELCRGFHAWAAGDRRIREVQAAALEEDALARGFWAGIGYVETGEVRQDDAGRTYRVLARAL